MIAPYCSVCRAVVRQRFPNVSNTSWCFMIRYLFMLTVLTSCAWRGNKKPSTSPAMTSAQFCPAYLASNPWQCLAVFHLHGNRRSSEILPSHSTRVCMTLKAQPIWHGGWEGPFFQTVPQIKNIHKPKIVQHIFWCSCNSYAFLFRLVLWDCTWWFCYLDEVQ